MPSDTPKQQRFFGAVKHAKEDPSYGSKEVRKVANSLSDTDIDDFLKLKTELKVKKAVLSILKDCREPMYLEEGETDVVVKEFNVEGKFEEYVKRYLGLKLSEKEMEAINTFQDVKPTKIEFTQIRYETSDEFKNNTTTIIKKLREGSDFVYVAFTKYNKTEKQDQQQNNPSGDMGAGGMGGGLGGGMGGSSPMFEYVRKEPQIYLNYPEPSKPFLMEQDPMNPLGAPMPPTAPGAPMTPPPTMPSPTTTAPMTGMPKSSDQRKKEMGIDDISIRKSTSFRDDIKGGSILAEFLKKLDL